VGNIDTLPQYEEQSETEGSCVLNTKSEGFYQTLVHHTCPVHSNSNRLGILFVSDWYKIAHNIQLQRFFSRGVLLSNFKDLRQYKIEIRKLVSPPAVKIHQFSSDFTTSVYCILLSLSHKDMTVWRPL
jgi:hypothetical protein